MHPRRSLRLLALSSLASFVLLAEPPARDWRDEGVVYTSLSPYAKLHDVPIRAVTIKDGIWGTRRQVNVDQSIPTIKQLLEEHGYTDNFRRLSQKKDVPKKGPVFADSDSYKWLEAVGFALQSQNLPAIKSSADSLIDDIVSIQEPSGYLNAHFQGDLTSKRLLPETMEYGHELYNLGHMMQGAVAFYRGTGDRRLMDAAGRMTDFLIQGYGPGKKPLLAGHPVIEMGLVEMYRTTGDRKYLNLASYILGGDERLNRHPERVVYTFSGTPFTSRKQIEGHSVRAMYACSGATDYYLETGDQKYWNTLEKLWADLIQSKVYVTGGVGSRWAGEAFGEPYELPNAQSYSETCAAIGEMMWAWRMLMATGDARFTDQIERALYNAINVGVSFDGNQYCYRNPLEMSDIREPNWQSKDGNIRNRWYDVLCCPPNIQRTLASLPGYFYSTSKDGVYVHLFHNSDLAWKLEDGTPIRIAQATKYPWEGTVDLTVQPEKAADFAIYLRVPGWSKASKVTVNGSPVSGVQPGQYLAIKRQWKAGDVIHLELDMNPQLIAANPRIRENRDRATVERGPLIFCLEKLDQPEAVKNLYDIAMPVGNDPAAGFTLQWKQDLLGGLPVLKHAAITYSQPLSDEPLYQPVRSKESRTATKTELTFIPYFAVANRESTAMMVWVPYFLQE